MLLTFWLGNALRATAACTFSDISTSKSAPRMLCLVHFGLDICFAPQRRGLFRHRSFSKCSEADTFCTFWLRNVLRATTTCKFSSPIWPSGSAPAASASLLFDSPGPQITGKHCESRLCYLFAHLPLLSTHSFSSLIFSLLLLSSLTLLPFAFPSVHIVGSLTSKLPSITRYHRMTSSGQVELEKMQTFTGSEDPVHVWISQDLLRLHFHLNEEPNQLSDAVAQQHCQRVLSNLAKTPMFRRKLPKLGEKLAGRCKAAMRTPSFQRIARLEIQFDGFGQGFYGLTQDPIVRSNGLWPRSKVRLMNHSSGPMSKTWKNMGKLLKTGLFFCFHRFTRRLWNCRPGCITITAAFFGALWDRLEITIHLVQS